MKKIISLFLAAVMVISMFAGLQVTSSADDLPSSGQCGENVFYTFDSATGTLTISGRGEMSKQFYNQTIKTVVIENGVTSIGGEAFYGCSGLTSITIPDSVTSIGSGAFWGCSGLTSVTIPDSVKSIGSYAFSDCSSLTKVNISSIEAWCKISFDMFSDMGDYIMGANPLYYAHNLYLNNELITNLTIPSSVTRILSYTFGGCSSITSVSIPDSVTSIGDYAFYGCKGLTSVTIPDSVTSIGTSAFGVCSSLTKVNISSIEAWCKISFSMEDLYGFFEKGANPLYYAHNLYLNNELITNLTIPSSVTRILSYTFDGCSSITSVSIPDSVTSIGDYAFYGCKGLTSVTIPDSVTSIGNSTFYGCSGLTSIKVDQNNKVYDSRNECNAIIETKSNILIVGCKKTVLPSSVTSIGDTAFSGLSIPTVILQADGIYNENVNKVIKSTGATSFVLVPGSGTMYDWSDQYMQSPWYLCKDTVEEITLQEGIKNISECAFRDCTALKKTNVPVSVTSIGRFAYYGCSNLKDITISSPDCVIPDSPNTIDSLATIHGYNHSTAQAYAEKYQREFISLGDFNCETHHRAHNYQAVATAPTCTEQGYTTYTCSLCGSHYIGNYVPALGHSWGAWNVQKDATCTAVGEESRVCTRDASHTDTRKVAALGHNYRKTVTKPTAAALGYTLHICTGCGANYKNTYTAPTGKQVLKCKVRTATAQTVIWNKVKSAAGYQVQISTKDGKKWSTYATLKAGVTSYSFKKLAAGNNYKFRVRFYIKSPEGNKFSPWSATLNSPTLPAGTYFTSVKTPQKKAFAVTWKPVSGISGYQIQTSTNAGFRKDLITYNVKKSSKNAIFKSGIKSNKIYYYRIRTYKAIGGKNYFSAWSKTYKVKTK